MEGVVGKLVDGVDGGKYVAVEVRGCEEDGTVDWGEVGLVGVVVLVVELGGLGKKIFMGVISIHLARQSEEGYLGGSPWRDRWMEVAWRRGARFCRREIELQISELISL